MTNIFDVLTEKYDAWYDSEDGRPLYESELLCLKPMVENCNLPILEIGAGTGRFAMHFPEVIGIDPAVNSLRVAEKRGVKTVHGCGENLPFGNEIFGCVLIIVTLCFVAAPLDIFKEARRVLKRDGSIITGVVPRDSLWGIFYQDKKRQGHPFYSGATFYNLSDIRKLLAEINMKVVRIRSTLLQRPDEPARIEKPVEGYVEDSGFLCIEAEKKSNFNKGGQNETYGHNAC